MSFNSMMKILNLYYLNSFLHQVIKLQHTQRVLFSKNETLEEDKAYVYFDDPALSFLQFGKIMEYNSSKIYGNYFHTELYKISIPTSITEPILRVLFSFYLFTIG